MFITEYRLPADYDMRLIRKRGAERGPYWDRYPGLIFKGFLVQEMGRSSANAYFSLFLWPMLKHSRRRSRERFEGGGANWAECRRR
jgi:hypothetical protein